MPDITMCTTKGCSKYEKCYRAQSDPNKYQSWANYDCDSEYKWFMPLDMPRTKLADEFVGMSYRERSNNTELEVKASGEFTLHELDNGYILVEHGDKEINNGRQCKI